MVETKKKIEMPVKMMTSISEKNTLNAGRDLNEEIDILLQKHDIKMEDIQKKIVPIMKKCDVFISYSHKDSLYARYIASKLINRGYSVFIDSLFWDSIDTALKKYNNAIKGDAKTYEYDNVIRASSSFHMILVNSIMDTIDSCDVFLFLRGEGVTNYRTKSPWLYFENKIANKYKNSLKFIKHSLFEDSKKNIDFPINTFDFDYAGNFEELIELLEE